MPKSVPSTSFTVSEVPFRQTEPLLATNPARAWGARKVTRRLSPSGLVAITRARPSTWPDTMCPPNSSPTFSARSRLTRRRAVQSPMVVFDRVSPDTCTSNQPTPRATAVRQAPSQAMEAPMSMPAVS